MKKTYTKPQLYVESFELSEHIASCSGYEPGVTTANHWSTGTKVCTFVSPAFPNAVIFNLEGGSCNTPYFKGMGLICYNSPSGGEGSPFAS